MAQREQAAHVEEHKQEHSPQETHERKQRVLTKRTPSVVRSIADAVVIKDEDLFFLCAPDGDVPLDDGHGYGLYYHDCRFLNGYALRLAGAHPDALAATAARGFMGVVQLTNPDIRMAAGRLLPKEHIGITWERTIDSHKLALYDLITVRNFAREPAEFPITLTFRSQFDDVFAIRGLLDSHPGTLRPPAWKDGALCLAYDGGDGVRRSMTVTFSPQPEKTEETSAHFTIRLESEAQTQILVVLRVAESDTGDDKHSDQQPVPDIAGVQAYLQHAAHTWLDEQVNVRTDNPVLNRALDRSLRDLRMLRGDIDEQQFFMAGVPWFATLFGRDSLISAMQALAYEPQIAAHTLRLLARYQGCESSEWRDEQPGKILHELRVGELARKGEIPQGRYYGTVDATLLFLVLLGRHAAWTGDLGLFHELRDNVERALGWMERDGDGQGWGYITYASTSDKGLINQGWKDSGNAIVNSDGSLAEPPIALVEVQGYAYLARQTIADLYEQAGERDRAAQLRHDAEELRARFNRDFWLQEQGFFALALQKDMRPAAVRSSNPGQALWTGIVDPDKARATADMLLADDMYTGWGIRTLSSRERCYNPIGYHLGTVWPHDNAIIAAGLRRYGYDDAFGTVFTGILDASDHFAHQRLPELFTGFERASYGVPVRYPVACHPQAWAAGAIPFMLTVALGLAPEALDGRLRVARPLLPEWTRWIELRGLKVGPARVDLRFEQDGDHVALEVLKVDGELEVVVEPDGSLAP